MVALANSKTIPSPLQELKLDRNARAVDGIDPHSGDLHCNDVSTYEPVVWKPKDCKKCTATFPKKSVDKSDKVRTFFCIFEVQLATQSLNFSSILNILQKIF